MIHRHLLASLALTALVAQTPARATDVALPSNGQWSTFAVDSLLAFDSGLGWVDDAGNALRFTFTIASGFTGALTILDTGFAGDRFSIFDGASLLGSTSAVPVHQYDPAGVAVEDPDAALADASFSRVVFSLAPGSYTLSGLLTQSVLLGNDPLAATSGALRLTVATVAPVPEPSSLALLLAGVGVVGTVARRRRNVRR
jgi:hypothetical protein